MKQFYSDNRKVAMQHQHLAKNTLFVYGRTKLQACTHIWSGKTTLVSTSKEDGKVITTKEEADYFVEAVSAYQMDADDQILFLTLLYLLRIKQKRVSIKAPKGMNATGWRSQSKTLQLTTNLSDLCKLLKITPAGNNFKRLEERLKRLSSVSLTCEVKGTLRKRTWSSSLLHWKVNEDYIKGGIKDLEVTFPVLIASAAHQQGMQIHSSHDLDELLKLRNGSKDSKRSKVSLLLHTALCSRIRDGNSQRLQLDTLIGYIQFSKNMPLKKQSYLVRQAVKILIEETSWKVIHEVQNEVYIFTRPKITKEKE